VVLSREFDSPGLSALTLYSILESYRQPFLDLTNNLNMNNREIGQSHPQYPAVVLAVEFTWLVNIIDAGMDRDFLKRRLLAALGIGVVLGCRARALEAIKIAVIIVWSPQSATRCQL
jgi:hypothetical protein